ncbi:alpha/beta fold hydrolase [Frankia sp. AgB32]|uniref:alpha/beta fold hydrolase n=1 Tax=Frankia sp. AgB32 TaxID=631119 RepID=UPI002010BD2D|nr:alpha/beta hydrolase [Frankia sp. AgB32]MCK9894816.1 alpha/beta hydrolase [Frankia sp. AgB32]
MGTEYLELPDGRIAYDVTGPTDGRLVVCLHGMGDTRRTFRFLVPRLAAAGYRVASVDMRGYGESSAGWPDYRVESTGADLVALIRYFDSPAVVISHSIACAAAAWAAAESPDDVSGLVLIATSSGESSVKAWMKPAARLVARSAALWGMYYRSLYPTTRPDDFDQYVKDLRTNLREPGRLAALRAQIAGALAGVRLRYLDVRCPTLIVMGTRDAETPDPAAEANLVAEMLAPTGIVKLIEGSGHYPHADMPDATAAAVLKFLVDV